MNSAKLESLSLEALYALAERMGLDLPSGLERLFVVEEILDALVEDSEARRPARDEAVHVDEKKYSGSELDELGAASDGPPQLEARYNETMIRALVRDPSWAFAYWDLSDAERVALASDDVVSPLYLRVVELDPAGGDAKLEHFDIPVSLDDLQWYINLPHPAMRFRIDLCSRKSGAGASRSRVLARSNVVASPRQELQPEPKGLDPPTVRLLQLSGIAGMHIQAVEPDNPLRITSPGADLQSGEGAN